jgi:hypothetical protein
MQNNQAEPSMEEILASIRRIISEDDEPQAPAAEAPMELKAPPAEPVMTLSAKIPPAPALEDDLVFEDDVAPTPPPQPRAAAPQTPRPAAPVFAAPAEEAEPIMSEPTVSAAAGAFTRLAGTLRVAEMPGQTLEGIVRELLRPMLKEWLDENLPAIVEARVEAEVDRIARLSR